MIKKNFTVFILSCITFISQAQTYNWDNVAIGGGGFVSAIITNKAEKDLVYARTDVGGAYRWDAANSKWIPLTDWVSEDQTGYLGIESLASDPINPAKVYMLAGISYFNNGNTAILRSGDYGKTFEVINVSSQFKAHGNGMGRQTGEKLVIDPNNTSVLYCGTRANGLFKSTNSGTTWTRLSGLNITTTPNENGISFVVLDPSSVSGGVTKTIYVGVSRYGTVGANLYKSTDGGTTFTAITGGPSNLMPHSAKLSSTGSLFVTYANGAGPHAHWSEPEPMDLGAVYKLNTSTSAWTNITPAGYTRAFGGISIDPKNENRILVSTINTYLIQDNAYGDRVLMSTNGGTSWTDVMANGVDITNNGVSWIDGHAIHWAGSIEFDPFTNNKVWITSGNGVFVNSNITSSPSIWKFEVKGLEETVPLDIYSIEDGALVSVIGDYDGFTHTNVKNYAPIHTPRMGTTTGLDVAANTPLIRVRVGDKTYITTNGGTTWIEATSAGKKGSVAVSTDGKVFLHSPELSTITYRSNNNGSSWTTVTDLAISEAKPTADPENATVFYAYDPANGNFYKSTNAGMSFTSTASIGSNGSKVIRLCPNKEGDIWVPMYNGGLKRSTNSGTNFSSISAVTQCGAVGFGKSITTNGYPTVFIWGTVAGVKGIFRSTDQGSSWTRINDDAHEYGGPGNGKFVIGDMNEYGRVYMSTAGRGIVTGAPIAGIPDCNNVIDGTASVDNCGVCTGGNTGKTANSSCTKDCNNVWKGTASIDNCTVCSGGTTGIIPNSTCPQPCPVTVKNDTICKAGNVKFDITNTGSFTWYDVQDGGTALATGTSYTSSISSTKTFYVASGVSKTGKLGKTTQGATGWGDNTFANNDKQIKIIVTEAITLNAVAVYTTANPTSVTINITDATNTSTIIGTKTVSGLGIGKQRIPLDIKLAPGTYLINAVGTDNSLFFESANGVFPYSIDNVAQFTFNASWANTWYGMFYDWEITYGTACIRVPVKGIINPNAPKCVTGLTDKQEIYSSVYPNPSSTGFTIASELSGTYKIYSLDGKELETGIFQNASLVGQNLPKGNYLLQLESEQKFWTEKLNKE